MKHTKLGLNQQYEKLEIKRDSLLTARVILLGDRYVDNQNKISSDIYKIITKIEKEMLKLEVEMLIFDIQDNTTENMMQYIKTLKKLINII